MPDELITDQYYSWSTANNFPGTPPSTISRYPPYGPFSLQGDGKTGVPAIDLAIPGASSRSQSITDQYNQHNNRFSLFSTKSLLRSSSRLRLFDLFLEPAVTCAPTIFSNNKVREILLMGDYFFIH